NDCVRTAATLKARFLTARGLTLPADQSGYLIARWLRVCGRELRGNNARCVGAQQHLLARMCPGSNGIGKIEQVAPAPFRHAASLTLPLRQIFLSAGARQGVSHAASRSIQSNRWTLAW